MAQHMSKPAKKAAHLARTKVDLSSFAALPTREVVTCTSGVMPCRCEDYPNLVSVTVDVPEQPGKNGTPSILALLFEKHK